MWHSGTKKPTEAKLYRRKLGGVVMYARWDGRQWLEGGESRAQALSSRKPSAVQEAASWSDAIGH